MTFKKFSRSIFRVFLIGLALVGAVFIFIYFAMQFGWLNVRGSVSERNSYFNIKNNKVEAKEGTDYNLEIVCQINVLSKYAPLTSINIYRTGTQGVSDVILAQMINVASHRFEGDYYFKKDMDNCKNSNHINQKLNIPISAYNWADTDQWNLMKEVFTRDQDIIKQAAKDADISPRLLLGGIIGEQFRFFNNRRETFKSYFEPLKILASLSNTSFGIAGLKPKTVGQIEERLKDKNSPYYLGPQMEDIIHYDNNVDMELERMNRITDVKNPYYSYLYVGLFMKEVMIQWEKAGYNINNRPEILATLYNLGFYYSVPKDNPEVGGSVININNVDYTFGDIAYEFYYSGELSNIFPIKVK